MYVYLFSWSGCTLSFCLSKAPSEAPSSAIDVDEELNVEYVTEPLAIDGSGIEAFSNVFARFQLPSEEDAVRHISIYTVK